MSARLLFAVVATFMLASCGGGSGSSRVPTLSDARIVPHDAVNMAASRTANSVPRFTNTGILQSSNTDSMSGITTDTVSTMLEQESIPTDFDVKNVKFTVSRQSGDSYAFDSATHSVTDTLEKRPLPPSPVRRHNLRDWSLFDYSETGTSAAYVSVSWHNEDPTDYLAGGYWMHLKGDLATDSITGVDMGTFIDGPEFSSAPNLPMVGTATYRGRAAGLYTYTYGPMWQQFDPRLLDGLKETGEFSCVATLTADFAASTIHGCIGCVENLETTGVISVDPTVNRTELYTNRSLASIKFAPTLINHDGTFTGADLAVVIGDPVLSNFPLTDVQGNFPVSNVQGSWGGRFSNRPASDGSGDPRLVAGTMGVEFSHPDGSQGVFVGNFFAPKVISQ